MFPASILLALALQQQAPAESVPRAAEELRAADEARVLRALEWLEAHAEPDAQAEKGASLGNADAKMTAVHSVVAWLERLYPERAGAAERCARLDARLDAAVRSPGVSQLVFADWMNGFAAITAFERELRGGGDGGGGGDDHATLAAIARGFAERQNDEGGWAHGQALGVSFYPSTLMVTTNLGLLALGAARRSGIEIDTECLSQALALVRDVQAGSGAIPYGGRPYQKGFEAGRTCGTVLALAALGLWDDPMFGKASSYVLRNVESVPDGHASPALHVFVGSLAFGVLGEGPARRYGESVLARVRAAQSADGSFDDVVAGSPDSLPLMGPMIAARAYRTALYAGALSAHRSRIVAKLRAERTSAAAPAPAPPAASDAAPAAPELARVWSAPIRTAVALALAPTRAAVLTRDARIVVLERARGTQVAEISAADVLGLGAPQAQLVAGAGDVLVWVPPPDPEALPAALAQALDAQAVDAPACLVSVAFEPLRIRWRKELTTSIAALRATTEGVFVLLRSSRLLVLDPATGAVLREIQTPAVRVNSALLPIAGGKVAIAAEAALECWNWKDPRADEPLWKRKNRARDLTPAAWSCLCVRGAELVAGTTSGTLKRLSIADGATIAEIALRGGIARLAVAGDRLLALAGDGSLHGLEGEAPAWTIASPGHEPAARAYWHASEQLVWHAAPGTQRLLVHDARTGAPVAWCGLEPGTLLDVNGRSVLAGGADGVVLRAVPK